ncbi:MAG: hypothetical protein JJ863_38620 [Deltaproteobacteria bacterium]|nr:hypothetical protein [Deltaproteobacteria bacterium]
MRNTFPYLLLALFSFYGCSDDVNCVEEPDDPDCVASCMDDPTLPGCGDMGPGDMGMGDAGPCGMCTGGDVCDEASGSCVACLGDGDCGDDVCLVDDADSANNECVGCVDSEDCSGALGTCDEENHECVGCLMDSDCEDPTAPQCNAGTCGDCTSHDACMGRSDTPACDEPSGECVECTVDSEETACPAPDNFACDPTLLTCTGAERGTLGVCQQCVSDSECVENHRCVPTTFTDDMGMTHEASYCLLDFATSGEAACPTRWPARRLATSVGGIEAEYCFVRDSQTTCDAVRAFGDLCPGGDDDCGVPGIGDGVCREGLCTYACLGDRDCANGEMDECTGADPTYCDPN